MRGRAEILHAAASTAAALFVGLPIILVIQHLPDEWFRHERERWMGAIGAVGIFLLVFLPITALLSKAFAAQQKND